VRRSRVLSYGVDLSVCFGCCPQVCLVWFSSVRLFGCMLFDGFSMLSRRDRDPLLRLPSRVVGAFVLFKCAQYGLDEACDAGRRTSDACVVLEGTKRSVRRRRKSCEFDDRLQSHGVM